jgi:hypothetical protein
MNNKKILELAEQADIIKRPNMFGMGWDYTISEHQLEKFAELIIEECANVAADHDALDIYEEIREHFEVEE